MTHQLPGSHQVHETKSPRIVEGDDDTGRHVEDHMVVTTAIYPRAADVTAAAARATRNEPDIPRCIKSISCDDNSVSRYFARRVNARTV